LTGSGEVDLDALLEDLCIMEKDMNPSSETESMLSEPIRSPNSPISPKIKVCCKILCLADKYMFILDDYVQESEKMLIMKNLPSKHPISLQLN